MTQGTNQDAPAPPKHKGTKRLSAKTRRSLAARNDPDAWKPVHYFFYGSLMDEQKLTDVLRLGSTPVLRPASIVGFSTKMWGPYPALIDGPPGNVVDGMVYEVRKKDHEKRLACYETDAYRCVSCPIKSGAGGEQIIGKTLVWAANEAALSVGSFDLEAWKRARS